MTGRQGKSELSLKWRLLALIGGAASGLAVLFAGEFDSMIELLVRLVGATFIAVTVYTVTATAGTD